MIYRMSKDGLISDNYKEQSFTLMVQDNICKMQNIKIKITIENEKEKKLESYQSNLVLKA